MYFTPFKRVIMMYIVKQSPSGVAYHGLNETELKCCFVIVLI